MKNFSIVLFTLFTGFLFMACESDDDAVSSQSTVILGTWEMRELGIMNNNNVVTYSSIETDGTCGFDSFTFLTNDRLVYTEYTANVDNSCTSFIDNGGYLMNALDLDLFFTPAGETTQNVINGRIQALSLTELVISYSEDGVLYFLKCSKI